MAFARSSATHPEIGRFARNGLTTAPSSSLTEMNCTCGNFAASSFSCGIWAMQLPHHVAQNSSTTGLPRRAGHAESNPEE